MASRAKFGRQARSAPSLTATIVALAQQYQAVRESNIVDAWKNGGEFEGKPVHDSQILAWFRARRDELSPSDPKWDYYNNQVQQYDFAIQNSKMELSYKQGKASNGQMASFYHTWANKLPVDSEAYRQREDLAAAYVDRGRAAGTAAARKAADDRYNNGLNHIFGREYAYVDTLSFIESEAHNTGILQPGETLNNIDPLGADGTRINQLWDQIAHDPRYAKLRAFFTADIKAHGGTNFNGDFSHEAFTAYTRTMNAAVNQSIALATKNGRKADIKTFNNQKDTVAKTKDVTSGFDATQKYEEARQAWLDVFQDPHATALEVDAADNKYIGQLTDIQTTLRNNLPPGQTDDRIGLVTNELKNMNGDTTPLAHWGGAFGPGGNEGLGAGSKGVAASTETADGVNKTKQDIELLTQKDPNGNPLYVMTKVSPADGSPSSTSPDNNATAKWGVIPIGRADPDAIFVVQHSDDPRGAGIVTAVKPAPITITSQLTNPTTGQPNPNVSGAPKPAAYIYTMPDGTTGYKFQDSLGHWLYTKDNPFGSVDPKTGATTVHVPQINPKDGTYTVDVPAPKGSNVLPSNGQSLLPSYYGPGNVGMTSSIAKSGYSLWLLTANPKDHSVYDLPADQIVRTLQLEVMQGGGAPGVASLNDMLMDADSKRAVYLGQSTYEQQRIRMNYLTGTAQPVALPYTQPGGGLGLGPSKEQAEINQLTAGGAEAVTRGLIQNTSLFKNILGSVPTSTNPNFDALIGARRNSLSPNPPPSAPQAAQPGTSLGGMFGAGIINTLSSLIAANVGAATPAPPNAIPTGRLGTPLGGGLVLGGSAGPLPPKAPPATAPPPAPKAPPPLSGKAADDLVRPPSMPPGVTTLTQQTQNLRER